MTGNSFPCSGREELRGEEKKEEEKFGGREERKVRRVRRQEARNKAERCREQSKDTAKRGEK